MEALKASYGSDSDSDADDSPRANENTSTAPSPTPNPKETIRLPPPPFDLLQPQNSLNFTTCQGNRVRSFPHIEGNYALHIFIPVRIPSLTRKQLASYMKTISSLVSDLYVIDADIALNELCKDDEKFEQVVLGREFHISLGRPAPIKVHQIDSIVAMLRQRLQFQRRFWMEFNKWEVFVNDELTRSFLSLEVTGGGLLEITRQICIVDEIYRLHGLPEFYKNPRPHISLVWALGDATNLLKPAAEELNKLKNRASPSGRHLFNCKFGGIECRIEARRRKWLEDNPEASSTFEPVVFDTSIVPWWAWVKRYHLPEAELLNGRAAMIGFFMAYFVDSLTGVGLVDQMGNFFCKILLLVSVGGVMLIRKTEDIEKLKKLIDEATFYDKQWQATWQEDGKSDFKN